MSRQTLENQPLLDGNNEADDALSMQTDLGMSGENAEQIPLLSGSYYIGMGLSGVNAEVSNAQNSTTSADTIADQMKGDIMVNLNKLNEDGYKIITKLL